MAMTEFTFNKEMYHLTSDMKRWCWEHVGAGGPVYADPSDWEQGRKWAVSSIFGRTTFYFHHDHDATVFALKWA